MLVKYNIKLIYNVRVLNEKRCKMSNFEKLTTSFPELFKGFYFCFLKAKIKIILQRRFSYLIPLL